MCLADKVFTIPIAFPAVSPTASLALLSFWTFYLQSCQVYLQNRSHFSAHLSSSTVPAKQPSSPIWILASYQTLCTVLTPSDCAFQQPEGSFNIEVRLGLILLWTIKWLLITAKVKSKVPTVAKVAHGTWPCLLLPCTPFSSHTSLLFLCLLEQELCTGWSAPWSAVSMGSCTAQLDLSFHSDRWSIAGQLLFPDLLRPYPKWPSPLLSSPLFKASQLPNLTFKLFTAVSPLPMPVPGT